MDGEKSKVSIVKRVAWIVLAAALVAIIVWVIVASLVKGGDDPDDGLIDGDMLETEEELIGIAEELLERSVLLNEIYFGDGIPYLDGSDDSSKYREADAEYLENIGIVYLDDLKKLTRGTFSDIMCEEIFSLFLTGASENGYSEPAHYIADRAMDEESGEYEELGILVYTERSRSVLVRVGEHTSFDYTTIRVVGKEGGRVKIQLTATVSVEGLEAQSRTKTVYIIKEADGWRLDSYSKSAYVYAE